MREGMGKYRGISIDSGKWLYGCLLHDAMKEKASYYILSDDVMNFDEYEAVKDGSVGQFTGETTSFNEDVFEGDKLSNNYGTDREVVREVKFVGGSWYMVQVSGKSRMAHSILLADYCKLNYKVTGNIHTEATK